MCCIGIVPARSGSKGFKHKNIAEIGGTTLLELAVNVAVATPGIDEVYVSTDSRQYEELAVRAGAKSLGLRGKHLASDTAKTIDVVLDLVSKLDKKPETVVLLQPTSPQRSPMDISSCLKLLDKFDSVVSLSLVDEPNPYKLKVVDANGLVSSLIEGAESETPRQELPKSYYLNGSIYAAKVRLLEECRSFFPPRTGAYIMSGGVNIDSEFDFELMNLLIKKGSAKVYGVNE